MKGIFHDEIGNTSDLKRIIRQKINLQSHKAMLYQKISYVVSCPFSKDTINLCTATEKGNISYSGISVRRTHHINTSLYIKRTKIYPNFVVFCSNSVKSNLYEADNAITYKADTNLWSQWCPLWREFIVSVLISGHISHLFWGGFLTNPVSCST